LGPGEVGKNPLERFTKPPAALVTTLGFTGLAAIQSDKSTARLYTDEELSLKCKVMSPTISIAPGALFPVEKPRTARLVKLPGVVSLKVAPDVGQIVPLGLACSRLEPPYAPNPKVKLLETVV
jgi:hypothetical protein